MANSGAVWGIDLGQCALKALRCTAHEEPGRIVAEAFDYIEYPKILSQPEADPVELVRDAIQQFLSRNVVKGDRVAISVSGQSGLARFIKLPPVESKKIPDIVKYEARQQIPFALEDVVWDYQQMAGGSEEEGFALETEVGLFAMKRDQVNRALKPFEDAGIEVDIVQLTPLSLYNFVTFDQMPNIPTPDQYDPENPPESTIVMSLGADTTDLVVTNGFRVWQRCINLGGNHFTKALTKQMKLTFAKAEHLKRNAVKAEDPKAVFQAMRPVFGDLKDEVQRSLSFFMNVDRGAKLGKIIALGNAMKLRGLQKYLQQNLGMDVIEIEEYRRLSGAAVTSNPAFKDNLLSFGVCYGLALQALGKGKLSTNLLPREILKDRMVRAKKPWAVAVVAVLLLACTVGFLGKWREWSSAEPSRFTEAFQKAGEVESRSKQSKTSFDTAKQEFDRVRGMGARLADIGDKRLLVAELYKAINDCLPTDGDKQPEDISQRNELHIDSIDMEYFTNLQEWFTGVKSIWDSSHASTPPPGTDPAAAGQPPADGAATAIDSPDVATLGADGTAPVGPDGAGWVVEIRGHHYHNKEVGNLGAQYVRNTLIRALEENEAVQLPGGIYSVKEIGIDYPMLVNTTTKLVPEEVRNPNVAGGEPGSVVPAVPATGGSAQVASVRLQRFDFVVQLAWKPTTQAEREAKRKQEAEKNAPPPSAELASGT